MTYYEYVMNRRIHPNDAEILDGLSGSLRQQVWVHENLVRMPHASGMNRFVPAKPAHDTDRPMGWCMIARSDVFYTC